MPKLFGKTKHALLYIWKMPIIISGIGLVPLLSPLHPAALHAESTPIIIQMLSLLLQLKFQKKPDLRGWKKTKMVSIKVLMTQTPVIHTTQQKKQKQLKEKHQKEWKVKRLLISMKITTNPSSIEKPHDQSMRSKDFKEDTKKKKQV